MKTMKYLTAALLALALGSAAYGQETRESVNVDFSDPSKPGILRAGLTNGGIVVRGTSDNVVVIQSRPRDDEGRRSRGKRKSDEGMYVIPNTSMGYSVEEEDNVMSISGMGNRNMELVIDVPLNTSLKLSCVNGGDIVVENVRGEIEANNTNGGIEITDVSGVVLANTTNGDIIVSFNEVTPEKAMSFITFNGKVDVTFPADIKADVKMKTTNGSIYSDFEIDVQRTIRKTEEEGRRGRRKISLEGEMYGKLNGGGPEIHFSTYNGSIYIRKR